MRAYKFRLYPSKAQDKELNSHLWQSKELWNGMLAFSKELYKNYGKFPTKKTLMEFVKHSGLYSQTGQAVANRLFDALWKKNRGFPRFKSFDRMKSLLYPQFGFSLGKKLKVTPFGEISVKKHREIEGIIKTLTLKREASGKWFAIFCVQEEKHSSKENRGERVGIDLGLTNFAALSNAKVIGNPRHFRKHEEHLASLQKRLSRCKKGSRNRKKAKLKVAVEHEKISNCRSDFLHKLSNELVNSYSLIALENLGSKEMAEHKFGNSINDAGWNKFANMIAYKAEGAGCRVEFVNPKNTTKECSCCGAVVEKTLSERTHACPFCGLSLDRDINAARNILKRATAGTAGSNASGDETVVSSRKEDAT
ncbi:MAG: RNA-guided endonuclease TnpB family protein [Candidatus Micrarchaeota archaeon]